MSVAAGIEPTAVQPQVKVTLNLVPVLTAERLRALDARVTTPSLQLFHGFEQLEIGRVKKVEDFQAFSQQNVRVQAVASLSWGDTLWVSPAAASQPPGPRKVRVTIERSMNGTGDISALGYYRVNSSTFVNGLELPELNYVLAKGPGGVEQTLGQGVTRHEFSVDVGARFMIESVLSILDGLAPNTSSPGSEYIKGGSDGAVHQVTIQPGLGLCLRSASGRFRSGDCR